jgi:hypothetical protein
MSKTNPKSPPSDIDAMLRRHIISRAKVVSATLLSRLVRVTNDLSASNDLGALGGLEGFERDVQTLRSFLLLLRQWEPGTFTT